MPPIENRTSAGTPLASQNASCQPMSRRSAGCDASVASVRTPAAPSDIPIVCLLARLHTQEIMTRPLQVALDDLDGTFAIPRGDCLHETAVLGVISRNPFRGEDFALHR